MVKIDPKMAKPGASKAINMPKPKLSRARPPTRLSWSGFNLFLPLPIAHLAYICNTILCKASQNIT